LVDLAREDRSPLARTIKVVGFGLEHIEGRERPAEGNLVDMDVSGWASEYARRLLSELPMRWSHTEGVARRARAVAETLGLRADGDVLVAAAFLHDVGYARRLRTTGFHPLDGAVHLRDVGRERVACLVAHHSGARWEAELLGLGKELAAFSVENSVVADALTYCDVMTGADGQRVTLDERVSDIERRHGVDSVVVQALLRARPELECCVRAVEAALANNGDVAGRRRWSG
jgi:putative nucleotidyltransferase with HDIG domain